MKLYLKIKEVEYDTNVLWNPFCEILKHYSQHLHSSTSYSYRKWYKAKSTLEGENVFVDKTFNNSIAEDNHSQTMLEGKKQFPFVLYLISLANLSLNFRAKITQNLCKAFGGLRQLSTIFSRYLYKN